MARKKNKTPIGWQGQIFSIFGLLMAVVVMPTTAMLSIGMLPTFVALFVDRSRAKTKAITVGALNLAGCMPFLLQLWTHGHSFQQAMEIVSDPRAVVVMYAAAGIGYIIDWVLTSFVAGLLYQRGESRRKEILKTQEELIKRWGREVTGEIPLDEYGFPLDQGMLKAPPPKAK
jgi:hypothetical protein